MENEPKYLPKCRHLKLDTIHNERVEVCNIQGTINPECRGCEMNEYKPTAQDVMKRLCELDQVEFIQWFNINFEAK